MDHGIKNGRNDVALEAVRNIRHIATLPEVTVRIIELVEDPDSSGSDLHSIISSDLALTARMLKVVILPSRGVLISTASSSPPSSTLSFSLPATPSLV